jgi:predicted SprT family Zn-dependent metalloprotease
VDAFWSQDTINEWNDEYSPRKMPNMKLETDNCESDVTLPNIIPSTGSLSRRSREIVENKKAFVQDRHSMAEAFLRELDSVITEGKLSEMAAPTGGIKIIWSKRLNTTAGRANWKLETIRSHVSIAGDKQATRVTYRHHASIELAEKVIDGEDRLLNVIAHEFCHLANFMVSGVKNNPHGKEFKTWAAKCSHVFGGRGIHVTTKHSYDIDYKYVWECSNCGIEFKRHSKSINTSKHQCGSCKGKLLQIKPKPRSNAVASEYQIFIKNNMRKVKEANPESPQKAIMGLLGKMYKEHKESKQTEGEEKLHGLDINAEDDSDSEEVTPGNSAVDAVARKLEFLDLVSP